MKQTTAETPAHKLARYRAQQAGRPLTEKQIRRLGMSPAEQHALVREEEPVTPQAALSSQRVDLEFVLFNINSDEYRVGTFDVAMDSKERFAAQKQLDAARSKVNRASRLRGVPASMQKVTLDDGTIVLRVHLDD
jgi:methylphosphotriester-DNA--protein-cysteine methyltransferase